MLKLFNGSKVATLQEMSLAQPKGMAEELMQVQCYTSVSEFMRDAEPIFADREAEHSVMIGVLGNLQKDMNFYNVEPELLALRSGSGSPVLLGQPLVLSYIFAFDQNYGSPWFSVAPGSIGHSHNRGDP